MIKFLIKRPIAVFMSFLAFALLGLSSINLMPLSLLPEIDQPHLKIQVDEPLYSSEELEKLVITPIRTQLLQVSKLDNIESRVEDGRGFVDLFFDYGVDIDMSIIEVQEKLDNILTYLPKNVNRPNVIKFNPTDVPLLLVSIPYPKESKSKVEFSNYIENVVKKRLEQIPSIAFIDISGVSKPEIRIDLKRDIFNILELKIEDIQSVIESNNVEIGNFKIRDGYYVYDILFEPTLSEINDIEELYIQLGTKSIQIKDIADVSIQNQESKGFYLYNNEESICLAVKGDSSSEVFNLKADITDFLESIKIDSPSIRYYFSQDQTKLLNLSINNLKYSLIVGAVFAFFVVLIFIKNIRISMIIGIVIPISLIISFLFLYLFGLTINIVSLSGLIIAVGMMIDNSIIVIDNISQYRAKGHSKIESCSKGTLEVLRPLLSSLLTTCSVFVPLIYLSGISGMLFYDQSIALIIALVVSYISSILLIPTIYFVLKEKRPGSNKIGLGVSIYKKVLDFCLINKLGVVVVCIATVALGTYSFLSIDKTKLPDIEYDEFEVALIWGENENITDVKEKSLSIISFLNGIEVEQINSFIGQQQFLFSNKEEQYNSSNFYIKTNSNYDLDQTQKRLDEFLSNSYPNAIYSFKKPQNLFERIFSTTSENFILKVPISYSDEINDIISNLKTEFPNDKFVVDNHKRKVSLKIKLDKLAIYKIENSTLVKDLKSAFGSTQISVFKNTNQYIPIVVHQSNKEIYQIISEISTTNIDGVRFPIKNLVSINYTEGFNTIYSDSNLNYVPIKVESENEEEIINFIQNEISTEIVYGGDYFENKTFLKQLIYILAVVILLLYFVLAAQFESLLQPLIIISEIPITVALTIVMMNVFDISLNIMSMIGIIIMLGIIVNDSILKIDTINKLRETSNILDAIHKGGLRRLNAIIMTSLTTVLAMTPILFASGIGADLQKPLAIVVIIAMIIGTLVSLFFVPVVYWLLTKKK